MGTRPTKRRVDLIRSGHFEHPPDAIVDLLAEIDALTDEAKDREAVWLARLREADDRYDRHMAGLKDERDQLHARWVAALNATPAALTARAEAAEGRLNEALARASLHETAREAELAAIEDRDAAEAKLAEAQAAVEGLRGALQPHLEGWGEDDGARFDALTDAYEASADISTAGRRALEEAREAGRAEGARAMLRLVGRRLRYIADTGEEGPMALVGLHVALAELPPLGMDAVVNDIIERDAREGERAEKERAK